jgi:hypothetical protein
MYEMTAFCGLDCAACGAYLATQRDDNEARAKLAVQWSTPTETIKAEDINCDGCKSETGRLLGFCNVCPTRLCGLERGVATCAHCDDYGCERVTAMFAQIPQTRDLLEAIRADLGK